MDIGRQRLVRLLVNIGRYILFFLGPGMLYQYLRKRSTWKRLEEYAARNGIERRLTDSLDDFGELHWIADGRGVTVRICYDNPNFGPWISVRLRLDTEMLDLKTYKPMTRPGEGWERFDSPDPVFNRLYRSRCVWSVYSDQLLSRPEIFSRMVRFFGDWMLYLSSDIGINGLVVDGRSVTCHFGPSVIRSMYPYITPEEIEAVLPDMLELADVFDSAFAGGQAVR
ncbi:MAG: hypothetical protein JXA64_09740 [Candidatus Fermentibacteraceae bacterium]|nr:hypothetical protein [Candidatus Fermentibacteraceae bacterium]MBN2609380.1 hypothetical protein [Candidatus Fermentibacteraceae bacterium]